MRRLCQAHPTAAALGFHIRLRAQGSLLEGETPLPTAHLTLAGHPVYARCMALAAGRFQVLIRWPRDLEHHFCRVQWEAAG